jgi:hypothetical protein
MTELTKVTAGIAKYLDNEIMPQIGGWQRWFFSASASAYLAKAPALVSKIKKISYIEVLEIIDSNNRIDVEQVYKYIRPEAEKNAATINIPMIGDLTLSVSDVDKLYSYIMQQ